MFSLHDSIETFLDGFDRHGLYPDVGTITGGVNEPVCRMNGIEHLMFGANDYLGLSQHPRVKAAANRAIEAYGTGPGASRLVAGNLDVIEELERRIAALTGTEDCLTFPTGYMANASVLRALMDPFLDREPRSSRESIIFLDVHSHGSVFDGASGCEAKKVLFRHDNLLDLEAKLQQHAEIPNKLIVTEGVYCLYGEVIHIPDYVSLARKYGATLMVDDAHGVGVLGTHGGGIGEHFGCQGGIDVLMGCMDKAFGGTGGYLCGKRSLIRYLRIACRSSVLSSAIPAGMAGAMCEAATLIHDGHDLRERLFANAASLRAQLLEAGFELVTRDRLPSVVLRIGAEALGIEFSRQLREQRIYCPLIRWPGVAKGDSRLRINLSALHQPEHLEAFVIACVRARASVDWPK